MSFENLKKLAERMKELQNKTVVVGVLSDKKEGDDINIAELAAVHEFGSAIKGIPERSFMRSTYSEQRANTAKILNQKALEYLRSGGSSDVPFNFAGSYLRGKIVDKIYLGTFTPLAGPTIKRKKSSKPLIDTGRLVNSITYEVRNGKP